MFPVIQVLTSSIHVCVEMRRSGICFGFVVIEFKFVCRPYFHVINICMKRRISEISFGFVVIEFKFVHCHPGFDVINTLLYGEEEISDLMGVGVRVGGRERRFLELRVICA